MAHANSFAVRRAGYRRKKVIDFEKAGMKVLIARGGRGGREMFI